MDFTFRQLRTFRDAAESGSLTLTAKRLGCSQSNVTTQIRTLETRFGAQLFVRTPSGVQLTPAGRTTKEFADRLFAAVDEMHSELRPGAGPTGTVTVASTPLLMEYEIGDLVRDCRRRHPGVTLALRATSAADVDEAVTTGQADIGLTLVADPADQPAGPAGISRQTLFELPLVPVGEPLPDSPGHQLAFEHVLVVDPACASHDGLLRHLRARYGIEPPTMEAGSARGAIGLACAGLGVTMLPERAVTEAPGAAGATVVPWLPGTTAHVQAVWNGTGRLAPAAAAFLELVRQAASARPRPALVAA
ncbi:LysR family transcriptional regulator [Kitasatospora sp. NPDC001664]